MVTLRPLRGWVGRAFPLSRPPTSSANFWRAAIWAAEADWMSLLTNHWTPPEHGGVVNEPAKV